MPLSKARDRERKQEERAKNRLDKLLSSSQTSKPVQPMIVTPFRNYQHPDIDADGNVIPEI